MCYTKTHVFMISSAPLNDETLEIFRQLRHWRRIRRRNDFWVTHASGVYSQACFCTVYQQQWVRETATKVPRLMARPFTLSGPRFFRYRKKKGGKSFEGARPEKSLKIWPFSKMSKPKSQLLNISQKNFFRNELQSPF